ncbi:MAG: ABC transporter permease [Chloroflexi bacterium]|nr:ABC transporter permease [Chloroflexota bacterium]
MTTHSDTAVPTISLTDETFTQYETESMTHLMWRQFKRHRMAVIGLIVVGILAIASIIGPIISPYDVYRSNFSERYQPPSLRHPMGTDDLGRDMLTRILQGGRISLSIGVMAMTLALVIGTTVGALSGFYGGMVDNLLMRFTDLMLSLPQLFVLILMTLLLRSIDIPILHAGGGVLAIVFVIALLSWMTVARLVRSAFLALREKEFVEAARALGISNRRIIIRHILPNALSPVIVAGTLRVASSIITESGLSFLGFGVQPPTPTWGNMLKNAQDEMMRGNLWMAIFPGLMIFITVIAINYIGDGLRDALDPYKIR